MLRSRIVRQQQAVIQAIIYIKKPQAIYLMSGDVKRQKLEI